MTPRLLSPAILACAVLVAPFAIAAGAVPPSAPSSFHAPAPGRGRGTSPGSRAAEPGALVRAPVAGAPLREQATIAAQPRTTPPSPPRSAKSLATLSPARSVRPATATAVKPVPLMTPQRADAFMETVARRESNAQRPGIMHDQETGLTFDGHPIDFRTGELVGTPRNWSAASKESLDVTLLVKAVQGDRIAQLAVSPTRNPSDAIPVALDRLSRKVESYRNFNERHPGYGGFLPWFRVDGAPGEKKMEPTADWTNRVPALDNGELVWSLYHAAGALRSAGHEELASKYEAQVKLMSKNVVRMFFEPGAKAIRAETRIVESTQTPPENNRYITNPETEKWTRPYLDDSAEGLLMVHFADLFGTWEHEAPSAREGLWAASRRARDTYDRPNGERITTVKGWRYSSHEDWGFLALPFRDVPVANELFLNAQRVRTAFSADGERPGLFASTFRPVGRPIPGHDSPEYENRMGIRSVAQPGTRAMSIYSPYAAFPLALADKPLMATWLKNMLSAPRMFGPNGMTESFSGSGKRIAPILTWDGKVLPLVAWSGGIADEVRAMLKTDGKYDRFIQTVAGGYSEFQSHAIEGSDVPLRPPSVGVPRGMTDFSPPK